jgi:hypothetical protein
MVLRRGGVFASGAEFHLRECQGRHLLPGAAAGVVSGGDEVVPESQHIAGNHHPAYRVDNPSAFECEAFHAVGEIACGGIVVASVETRAKRRFLENKKRGIESNLIELKKEIIERDYQDSHRKHSPLKKAADAIEIDTSELTIEEDVNEVLEIVNEKL